MVRHISPLLFTLNNKDMLVKSNEICHRVTIRIEFPFSLTKIIYTKEAIHIYKIRPADVAWLRSLVCVFLRPLPIWICSSKPLRFGIPPAGGPAGIGGGEGENIPGMGGGGGAPPAGIGGGGGAPPEGIGGGGGAPLEGIGGGGGGEPGAGELGFEVFSIADMGRGGAMVPKRIDARCFALPPPVGWSSSSSSSLDSTTDQSSSSDGFARERPEG